VQVQVKDVVEAGSNDSKNVSYWIDRKKTNYKITVITGTDKNKGARTTALVNLTLYGKFGGNGVTGQLDKKGENFEGTDTFLFENVNDVGDINKIELESNQLYNDHWHLKVITIKNENTEKSWTFKIDKELDRNNVLYRYKPS
jgi:hypothetical protein